MKFSPRFSHFRFGRLLSLLVLFFGIPVSRVAVFAQTTQRPVPEKTIRNIENPAAVTLDIYLDAGGSARIEGYNGQEVLVYDEGRTAVEVASQPSVRLMPENGRVKAKIRIPYAMSIRVYHSGGISTDPPTDRIEIRDISGSVEVTVGGADIFLSNVSGSASVSAWSGSIEAQFFRNMEPTVVALSTNNGDIDVALPERIRADLFLWSLTGTIESDFEVARDATNRLAGTLNGGGPRFEARVLDGNIRISKRTH